MLRTVCLCMVATGSRNLVVSSSESCACGHDLRTVFLCIIATFSRKLVVIRLETCAWCHALRTVFLYIILLRHVVATYLSSD